VGGAVPPAGAFRRRRSDCILGLFEVRFVAVAIRLRFGASRNLGSSTEALGLGLGLSPDKTF
jgi:hypothetical protein